MSPRITGGKTAGVTALEFVLVTPAVFCRRFFASHHRRECRHPARLFAERG
jgi:hypothetical protein